MYHVTLSRYGVYFLYHHDGKRLQVYKRDVKGRARWCPSIYEDLSLRFTEDGHILVKEFDNQKEAEKFILICDKMKSL